MIGEGATATGACDRPATSTAPAESVSAGGTAQQPPGAARQSKTVFLVRHAESLENEKLAQLGRFFKGQGAWSDLSGGLSLLSEPSIIDSPLSAAGRQQVEELRARLSAEGFLRKHGVQLVVHSQLRRARETCEAGVLASCESSRYPVLEERSLHEKYVSEWLPGMGSSFAARIQQFGEWVASRDEQVILVVGHSQFWRAMLRQQRKFDNCDVYRVRFSHDPHNPNLHEWIDPEKVVSVVSKLG
jgi:broad specificity phosphatase PhoE